jgi:hypothetical protein
MRRFIAAAVSIGERLVFLFGERLDFRFGDTAVLGEIPPAQFPNEELLINLITRGQDEGVFDSDLNPTWIQHALYGLILRGCEQAMAGELPHHTVAPLITRTDLPRSLAAAEMRLRRRARDTDGGSPCGVSRPAG